MELYEFITAGSPDLSVSALLDYHGPLYLYQISGEWNGEAFVKADRILARNRTFQRGPGLAIEPLEDENEIAWAVGVCEDRTDYVIGFAVEMVDSLRGFWTVECYSHPPAHQYNAARAALQKETHNER